MSAYSGPQHETGQNARTLRAKKRAEAETRSMLTPHERTRAHREGRCTGKCARSRARAKTRAGDDLTPEERLLRAVFGEQL